MSFWLFGAAIAVLVGSVSTFYLWVIRRRDDETSAGLLALAGLRWRDFSKLVLDAMAARGLERAAAIDEEPQEHSASFILSGQGKRWLLACKHGSAYRIGSAAMEELASDVRLHGASSGILVTEGTVDKGGLAKAEKYKIEVVDGARLWIAARPLMERSLQERISTNASERARRHIGIVWLAAVTLGIVSAVSLSKVGGDSGNLRANSSGAEPSNGVGVSAPGPSPAAATVAVPAAPRTELELELDRAAISETLSHTPGISRGVWITKSTLSVDREIDEKESWLLVCTVISKYPDLAFTRVQMNPPPGSTEQVRWRQCGM